MRDCRFWAPPTLDDALSLISSFNGQATLLAGGTDVVVDINTGKPKPSNIVYLGDVPGLADIYADDSYTYLRAMATHESIASTPSLTGGFSLLSKASSMVGCPSV